MPKGVYKRKRLNKICERCGKEPTYGKSNNSRYCSGCRLVVIRELHRGYHRKFHKTPWDKRYHGIRSRCCSKGYYGKKGIKNLITANEIKKLWFRDKAWLLEKPNIDRIDTKGNYVFSNCRFIENRENVSRAIRGRPSHRRKIVRQYNLKGKFLREYPSLTSASESIKRSLVTVHDAITGKRKTSGGYKWEYA